MIKKNKRNHKTDSTESTDRIVNVQHAVLGVPVELARENCDIINNTQRSHVTQFQTYTLTADSFNQYHGTSASLQIQITIY